MILRLLCGVSRVYVSTIFHSATDSNSTYVNLSFPYSAMLLLRSAAISGRAREGSGQPMTRAVNLGTKLSSTMSCIGTYSQVQIMVSGLVT